MTTIGQKPPQGGNLIAPLAGSEKPNSSAALDQSDKTTDINKSNSKLGAAAVVDLSDRAKAILERNKVDQAVADKLAAQLQATKDASGKGTTQKPSSDNNSELFDKLSGRANSSQTPIDPSDKDAYLNALIDANRQLDGTVKSFSRTESDVLLVPSTPQDIDEWYNTTGQTLIAGARQNRDEAATGIIQAIQNRTIKIQSAKDIPDLNFHNKVVFEGGENGSSVNGTESYNKDSSIFKDSTTNYRVSSNGYVYSWKKPEGDATVGVDFTNDPIIQFLPKIRF